VTDFGMLIVVSYAIIVLCVLLYLGDRLRAHGLYLAKYFKEANHITLNAVNI